MSKWKPQPVVGERSPNTTGGEVAGRNRWFCIDLELAYSYLVLVTLRVFCLLNRGLHYFGGGDDGILSTTVNSPGKSSDSICYEPCTRICKQPTKSTHTHTETHTQTHTHRETHTKQASKQANRQANKQSINQSINQTIMQTSTPVKRHLNQTKEGTSNQTKPLQPFASAGKQPTNQIIGN